MIRIVTLRLWPYYPCVVTLPRCSAAGRGRCCGCGGMTMLSAMVLLAGGWGAAQPVPPDRGFGVSSDEDFARCVLTCRDLSGTPAPQLCHSLGGAAPPSFEVWGVSAGGARDNYIYGANGSEWRQWLPAQGKKVTTIPVFNSAAYGFSSSVNDGLLCEAHKRGIRVVDSDIVGGMFGAYALAHGFGKVVNATAMREFVELAVHMVRVWSTKHGAL
jgi:hypothetical protein